jgi:S1-C subfamily serine protease
MKVLAVAWGLMLASAIVFTGVIHTSYLVMGYPSGPSLQAEVLNATVRVEIRTDKGTLAGSGSGTAIDRRHVLTNQHVIAGLSDKGTLHVRGWVREGERVLPVIYSATVVTASEDTDLALLRLDADWVGAIGGLADTEPPEAATVCKSGSAHGKRPRIACGPYAGHDEQATGGIVHVSSGAATAPGDSGGGVWSAHEGNYRIIAVSRAVPMIPIGMGGTLITTTGLAIGLADVRAFIAESLHDD